MSTGFWVSLAALVAVLTVLAYCLISIEIEIKPKKIKSTPVVPAAPSVAQEWALIYEVSAVLDCPVLSRDAAYWLSWSDGNPPDLAWLEHTTAEDRLTFATGLFELEDVGSHPARLNLLVAARQEAWNRRTRERAQKAVEAREHNPGPGVPAAISQGATDHLGPPLEDESATVEVKVTAVRPLREAKIISALDRIQEQLAQSLNVPEPLLNLGVSDEPCVHVWNAGSCTKCSATRTWAAPGKAILAQVAEQLNVPVDRVSAIYSHADGTRTAEVTDPPCYRCDAVPKIVNPGDDVGPARVYRESCHRCAPAD